MCAADFTRRSNSARAEIRCLADSAVNLSSLPGHTDTREAVRPEPASIDITTAPLLGRNKAWFYGRDKNGKGLILAFVNAKGSSSVRPFDAETGIALGKRYGTGPYQESFSDLIEGATELTVDAQPNLERDCKQRLPERLLAYLKKEIEKVA